MTGCSDCSLEVHDASQARALRWLLAINAVMFVVELAAGWWAQSSGLIADSLDMLADASVYALALAAVGGAAAAKARAATLCGVYQVVLAGGAAFDVARRTVLGSAPEAVAIMGVGGLALAANVTCLLILARHRKGEVHMRATWICSRSDVLANLGVIAGGALVAGSGSRFPDLIVGAVIVALVLHGGITILRETAQAKRVAVGG